MVGQIDPGVNHSLLKGESSLLLDYLMEHTIKWRERGTGVESFRKIEYLSRSSSLKVHHTCFA